MITKRELDQIRAEYPAGTHVKLAGIMGESQMEPGLKGIVTSVDDIGQIHVRWENGSTLELTEDSLDAMQEVVGGLIQEYMPFHSETDPRYDDLALICNEEGKLMGMKP